MAVESYEQIMARLQGQQAQAPTAASDFANYVQTLLLNPNPQGNMMTDAEAYRADPFRRQNAINANLDAALKKKQMEEEAARAAAAGGGMGMMGGGSGGSDSPMGRNAIQDREDALRAANLPEEEVQAILAAEQEARGKSINDFLTNLSKGGLFGIASQLLGGGLRPAGQNVPNVNMNSNELARQQLQSNLTAQNTRNLESAAIARAEAAKAAAIQAAAAEAARAANPFSMVAYNESAGTGDWGWFDNASSGQQDSIISNFESSDAAGNAAAAATGYYGAGDI